MTSLYEYSSLSFLSNDSFRGFFKSSVVLNEVKNMSKGAKSSIRDSFLTNDVNQKMLIHRLEQRLTDEQAWCKVQVLKKRFKDS